MARFRSLVLVAGLVLLGVMALSLVQATGQAPKYGGGT